MICHTCKGKGYGHFPLNGMEAGDHVVCPDCGGTGQVAGPDPNTGLYTCAECGYTDCMPVNHKDHGHLIIRPAPEPRYLVTRGPFLFRPDGEDAWSVEESRLLDWIMRAAAIKPNGNLRIFRVEELSDDEVCDWLQRGVDQNVTKQ